MRAYASVCVCAAKTLDLSAVALVLVVVVLVAVVAPNEALRADTGERAELLLVARGIEGLRS